MRVERHRAIDRESVRLVAAQWLDTRNRVLLRFHPELSAAPSAASITALDRSKTPALGADVPFHAPTVQTTKLENGLSIFVVERKDLPKVVVQFSTQPAASPTR